MKDFSGNVLFLDRSDINTDEIIPARHLSIVRKEEIAPYCLEDLEIPGFDRSKDLVTKRAVVTRENFGCGSSREHAPWVFELNGINIVVAVSFARIFRQNMLNCGLLPVELSEDQINELFSLFPGKPTTLITDIEGLTLTFSADKQEKTYDFILGEFDKKLILAEGWVNFAVENY